MIDDKNLKKYWMGELDLIKEWNIISKKNLKIIKNKDDQYRCIKKNTRLDSYVLENLKYIVVNNSKIINKKLFYENNIPYIFTYNDFCYDNKSIDQHVHLGSSQNFDSFYTLHLSSLSEDKIEFLRKIKSKIIDDRTMYDEFLISNIIRINIFFRITENKELSIEYINEFKNIDFDKLENLSTNDMKQLLERVNCFIERKKDRLNKIVFSNPYKTKIFNKDKLSYFIEDISYLSTEELLQTKRIFTENLLLDFIYVNIDSIKVMNVRSQIFKYILLKYQIFNFVTLKVEHSNLDNFRLKYSNIQKLNNEYCLTQYLLFNHDEFLDGTELRVSLPLTKNGLLKRVYFILREFLCYVFDMDIDELLKKENFMSNFYNQIKNPFRLGLIFLIKRGNEKEFLIKSLNNLGNFIRQYKNSDKFIIGVDCASKELGNKPNLYINIMKNFIKQSDMKEIKLTYHVGEEFEDLIHGFRNIYGVIVNMPNRSRISQSIPLIIDMDKFFISNNFFEISFLEYLNNYLWISQNNFFKDDLYLLKMEENILEKIKNNKIFNKYQFENFNVKNINKIIKFIKKKNYFKLKFTIDEDYINLVKKIKNKVIQILNSKNIFLELSIEANTVICNKCYTKYINFKSMDLNITINTDNILTFNTNIIKEYEKLISSNNFSNYYDLKKLILNNKYSTFIDLNTVYSDYIENLLKIYIDINGKRGANIERFN